MQSAVTLVKGEPRKYPRASHSRALSHKGKNCQIGPQHAPPASYWCEENLWQSSHLYWLIYISDVFGLHISMLLSCAAANKLWKGRKQTLDPDSTHVNKLTRHQSYADQNQHQNSGAYSVRSMLTHSEPLQTSLPLPVLVTMEAARTTMLAYEYQVCLQSLNKSLSGAQEEAGAKNPMLKARKAGFLA